MKIVVVERKKTEDEVDGTLFYVTFEALSKRKPDDERAVKGGRFIAFFPASDWDNYPIGREFDIAQALNIKASTAN